MYETELHCAFETSVKFGDRKPPSCNTETTSAQMHHYRSDINIYLGKNKTNHQLANNG